MDLQSLEDFNLVAVHGGFGRASRASGRPKASLSRRIMALEESLGVRLIERGATALRLTEEGAALHARTEGLLAEIAEAGRSVASAAPAGRLRVSAPVAFSHMAMGRVAAGFIRAFPLVRLEVVAEDREADLIEDGLDVVIRINPRPDTALVGRCFVHDRLMVVALPGMARPEGEAVQAVVLQGMRGDAAWRVEADGRVRIWRPQPVLVLSSLFMVRQAVLDGAGAGLLPHSMVGADVAVGRLVCWGMRAGPEVEIWALHASTRLASGKVTAFVRYLCEAFAETGLTDERRE